MSTGSTSNYSLSYPLSTDPVNVAGDIQDLAEELDLFLTNPAFINNVEIDGGSLTTSALSANLFNTNATTLNIGGAATTVNIGNASGQTNLAGDINIATGKQYEINNISVLTATTLGSSVVNSSLTSVGTIATGTWSATEIAVNKGGTGLTSYTAGDLVYASASTTIAKLGIGSSNYVLTSNGSLPTWTANTGTGNVVRAASPTLSGTPLAPTAAVDTNTTQIATTAFVIGQGYLKSATAASTYAPIASPTFTGTVNLPVVTISGTTTVSNYINRITGNGNSSWLQQDGTGRVHWYWNTYGGTSPTYTNAGEDAAAITMHTGDGGQIFFRSASGSGKSSGDPISWTTTLYASINNFTYKNNKVWHQGNTGSPTSGGIVYGDGANLQLTSAGSAGQVLTSNGTSAPTWEDAAAGGGTADVATVLMFAGM